MAGIPGVGQRAPYDDRKLLERVVELDAKFEVRRMLVFEKRG